MTMSSVTTATGFVHTPAFPGGLLQVNAGIETGHALRTAACITSFIQTRLDQAVQDGMDSEEAWVHSLLLDMATALQTACGATA